jgi:ribonuclease P protein component
VRAEFIDVRTLVSPLSYPRVGIVVPRFQHTIVERKRRRRRLRELVRTRLLPILPPQDVLLRANPRAYGKPFAVLESEIRAIAGRLSSER